MPAARTLASPVTLGALALPHRVLMAPMTRNRATPDGLATGLMATYYAQRASAGLVIAEMTYVSPDGKSYLNTPGISNEAEAAAWQRVAAAVHAAGGRIVLQIAHGGRASHPSLLPDRRLPVAPSAIAPAGVTFTAAGPQPFVTPRALASDELPAIVAAFARAARLARAAGFDGVELHAANGYLLDQFLRDGANQRTDAYGGSASNRARLLTEVVDAVAGAIGADRVGVRVSPFNPFNSMSDSDPANTFATVASALQPYGLAYLHVLEPVNTDATGGTRLTPRLKDLFRGAIIANGGYTADTAELLLAGGEADAVAFGTPFLANPDLPARLANGDALNVPDANTFYMGGERGYTDYPSLAGVR
ncbi:MAG: alkene reductase [Acidobacteria bacterium]|nr:alkene reductase [Acidobacteriota bacterium]